MPTRNANAVWEGGLKGGKGSLATGGGLLKGQYSFSSRFENGPGTNPEELLASAEAGCFSMALAGALERAGKAPTSVKTDAACTVEKVGEGFKVTKMHLVVRATVPGIDDAEFQKIAAATKEGCPISGVMKGNVAITMDAKLA